MKFQSLFRFFVPISLLLAVAATACTQNDAESPTPIPLPAASPTEAPRPLTAYERAAIGEFEAQLQSMDDEWQIFHQDFDAWRSGLVECHPSAARDALQGLAARFSYLAEEARNLPRTSGTLELADLVIAATDAEETAFRQLRDRWRAGNITLFELAEQRRIESALAHNSAADMSLSMQQELQDRPTFEEIDAMEAFSKTFDAIADQWDDFHDAYAAFAMRESKLDMRDRTTGYNALVVHLDAIMTAVNDLETSKINEDIVDALQEAAEDEAGALQFLADFPPDLTEEKSGPAPAIVPSAATTVPDGASQVDPAAAQTTQPALSTPAVFSATQVEGTTPEPPEEESTVRDAPNVPPTEEKTNPGPMSPIEELKAAIAETETLLEDLENTIEDIVNDRSALRLEELDAFDERLSLFIDEWQRFYEVYNEWRSSDGGCDSVEVGEVLAGYSQQASELSRMVDDLPQSGLLLPVYTLTVDAAERESGAVRTLANIWSPFTVDAFRAVDDERVNARRLRRQAGIALEELSNRP